MPNSDHNSMECEPYSVSYTQRIGKILELRQKKDRIKRDDVLVSRSHGESFRMLTTDLSRSHSRERTFGIVSSSIDTTNKRSNSRERSSSLNNNNNNNVNELTNERIIKSFEREMQLQRDIIAKERQEAALLQVKQESYINFLKNKGNSPWLPYGGVGGGVGGGAPNESSSAHASINKSATKQGLIQKAWMRSPWPGLIKTSHASTNGNSGNPSANNSFTSMSTSNNKRSSRKVSPNNNRDDTLSIASSSHHQHHQHHDHRSAINTSTGGRLRSLSADRIIPLRSSSTNERMLSRSRSGSFTTPSTPSTSKATGRDDNRSSKYIALTVRMIDVASVDANMTHGVFIVPKGCTKKELIGSIEKQFNVFDKISDISITYRSGYEHKVLVKSLSMSTIEEVPVIDEYSSITVFLNGDTVFDSKGKNNNNNNNQVNNNNYQGNNNGNNYQGNNNNNNNYQGNNNSNSTVIRVVSKASLENDELTSAPTIGKEELLLHNRSSIDLRNKTIVAVEAVGSNTSLRQHHEHKPSATLPPSSSSSSSSLLDLQLLTDSSVNHHHQYHHHDGTATSTTSNYEANLNFEQGKGISERDQLYSFSPSSDSLRRCYIPIPITTTTTTTTINNNNNRTTVMSGIHPFSASSNMPLAGIASEKRTMNHLLPVPLPSPLPQLQKKKKKSSSSSSRSEIMLDESIAHRIQESSAFSSPKRIDGRADDNYYNYADDNEYGGLSPTSTNDTNSYKQRNDSNGAVLTIRHLTGKTHSFDDDDNNNGNNDDDGDDDDTAMIQLQIEIDQLKRVDHSRKMKVVQPVNNPPPPIPPISPPTPIPPQLTNVVDPTPPAPPIPAPVPAPLQSVISRSNKLIDFSEYKSKLVGSAHSKEKRHTTTPSIGNAVVASVAIVGAGAGAGAESRNVTATAATVSNVVRDRESNRSTTAVKAVTKLEIERYEKVRHDDDGHDDDGHDDDDDEDIDFHPTSAPSDGNNSLLDIINNSNNNNNNNSIISIDLDQSRDDDFAIDLYDSLLNDDDESKTVGSYLDEHIHQLRDSYFKKSSSPPIVIITTNSIDDNDYHHGTVEAKENIGVASSSSSSSIEPSIPISVCNGASTSRSTSSSKRREISPVVIDADHNDDGTDDHNNDDDHDDDDAVKKSSGIATRMESVDQQSIQTDSLDDRLSQLQRQHTSFLRSSSSSTTVHDYHTNNNNNNNNNMTNATSHTLFDDGNNNNNNYLANNDNNSNNSLLPVVSTDAIDGHRKKQQSIHPMRERDNRMFFSDNNSSSSSFPSSNPLTDGSIHSNGIYIRHNSSERRRRDYITSKLLTKPSLPHTNNQPVLATKDYFERNQGIKSRYSAVAASTAAATLMASSSEYKSSQMYERTSTVSSSSSSSSTKRESSSVTGRRRSKSPSGTSSSSSSSVAAVAGSRIKPNPIRSLHHHQSSQQLFYASALLDNDNNDDDDVDHENKQGRRRNADYIMNDDDYVDGDHRRRSSGGGGGYDPLDYDDSSAHNKHVDVIDDNNYQHNHHHRKEGKSRHSITSTSTSSSSSSTREWDRRTAKHQHQHQQIKHHQPYRPAKYVVYGEDNTEEEVFQTLSSEKKTSSSSSSSYVSGQDRVGGDDDYGDGGRNASSTRSITRSIAAADDDVDVVRDILSNTKIRGGGGGASSNRQVYIKLDELLANL